MDFFSSVNFFYKSKNGGKKKNFVYTQSILKIFVTKQTGTNTVFKISAAASDRTLGEIKVANRPFFVQQLWNLVCKYGCQFVRPALYYIQDVGSKILWDRFTVPCCF